MKKILVVLMMLAVAAGTAVEAAAAGMATSKKVKSDEVISLVRNYNSEDGFNVVSVGNLGLGLVKMIARASVETEEDRAALEIMNGLHKVVVLEYDDAKPADKNAFTAKLSKILDGAEKILEVKDDGDTVNIYGTSADKDGSIDDIIIFVPEECALVCLLGTISSDSIADLVKVSD